MRRRLIYFNPRSPHGERLKLSGRTSRQKEFQSTLPARGATKLTFAGRKRKTIFQSTPPARGATGAFISMILTNIFQSTLPARGATEQPQGDDRDERQFQSTLPARGATVLSGHVAPLDLISIHAPRTGSDRTRRANITTFSDFNPRSPHGERLVHGDTARRQSDFNPRSPHGERRATCYGIR